jgi:hypothetical protein
MPPAWAARSRGTERTRKLSRRDECQMLIEEEMEYQRLRGYIRVTAEAVEPMRAMRGRRQHPG